MRVINSKQRTPHSKKRRQSRKLVLVGSLILLFAAGGFFALNRDTSTAPTGAQVQQATNQQNNNLQIKASGSEVKIFTGKEFHELYERFVYPNTAPILETTPITGNETADADIREVAVERGYALRSAPVTDAFQEVEPDMKLQQRAAQPWLDLKAEAKKERVNISLSAAFRSADEQRQIFNERLMQTGLTPAAIAAGHYHEQISQVLRMTAIPGYSRHHTGYTIDIACDDQPTTSFEYTSCFEWLSANNYEKVKKHGWIPSYPEGSGPQGPDPETWEYVWVGIVPLTR